jgi:O-antigen ligase
MQTHAEQTALVPRTNFFYFWCVCLSLFVVVARPAEVFPFLAGTRLGLISFALTGISFFAVGGLQTIREGKFTGVKLMLLFLLLGFVVILFSDWPRMAFKGWRTILLINAVLFFFWLPVVQRSDQLKKIVVVVALAAGSLVTAMLFVDSVVRYRSVDLQRLSVGATYDPNDIAMILAVILPLTLFCFLQARMKGKMFWGGMLVCQVLGIVSTGSRGGLLALGVGSALLFFSTGKNLKPWHRFFVVALLVFFVMSPAAETVKERWQEVLSGEDYNVVNVEEGGVGRLSLWLSSTQLVVANPITGVGVTNSITAMGEEYGRWRALHNSYLQVALELGLGGLILYLLLLRLIWRNCSLALAQFQVSGDQKAMELLAVCTRVALITYMVAALFLSQAYSLMVPILLLLSEGLVKISSEKGEVI